MEYRYNAERDRLERLTWNPVFFRALYEDPITHQTTIKTLYSLNGPQKSLRAVAEQFAEGKNLVDFYSITKNLYQKHFLDGVDRTQFIADGKPIPQDFIFQFLMAKDYTDHILKRGDLSQYDLSDKVLRSELEISYLKASPDMDIVREVEEKEITVDRCFEAYKESIAQSDAQEAAKRLQRRMEAQKEMEEEHSF